MASLKFKFFLLKYPILFAIFFVSLIFFGDGNLFTRISQWQEIARLKGEIDEQNRRFNSDKQMLDRLKNDPDALKEVARMRYYMKAENEDIFVIEDEDE